MRTNIEIDDALLAEAMKTTGLSKRATVEAGLRLLIRARGQSRAIADLEGLGWDGDRDEMRRGRPSIWTPDVGSPAFLSEAHRQSLAVATSPDVSDDQAFIDSASELGDE